MAESRREETILSQYHKNILLTLLGKSKLLPAIFLNRYRGKEATVRSITVHQSLKLYCPTPLNISFLELQWQLNHFLIKFADIHKYPPRYTFLYRLIMASNWEQQLKSLPPSSFLQFLQVSNIAIVVLYFYLVLYRIIDLKAWEVNVGILPMAENVYSIYCLRIEEITTEWFCFLETVYRLNPCLSPNCHRPPF